MGGRHRSWKFYRLVDFISVILIKKLPLKTLHLYVLLAFLLFLGVEYLRLAEIPAPRWIFNYLNDFLIIPIVGLICLHVIWLFKRNYHIKLDLISILLLVIIYSFYFEIYLPPISDRYTDDFWDVICYILGGIILYFLQKCP